MVRVGRLGPALTFADFQAIHIEDVIEAVVPHGMLLAECFLVHSPQFATADPWILPAYLLDIVHHE